MSTAQEAPESYEDLPNHEDDDGVPEGYCPYCTYKPCQKLFNGCHH